MTRAEFSSLGDTAPHAVQVYVRSDSGSACLVLAPHCAQSLVVCAGCTRRTSRPCLRPISIRAFLVAPMAASAALRAIDVLARNFGRKSSTAMASWSVTTRLAHLRAVSCRCRATFLHALARNCFAWR
jgi:hypothetical protein